MQRRVAIQQNPRLALSDEAYTRYHHSSSTVMGRPVSQQIFFGLGKAGYKFFGQKKFVGII
jgi:hypothetical protein